MTKVQADMVAELYVRGVKMEAIVAASGKHRVSIQRFLKRRGITRRPPGKPRKDN